MTKTSRKQFGFSLLEALIALLVMSFGMLALASMQLSLSRSADVAKQRTEAMRLAQERIETLRSFVSSAAWDALANGSDTATANTNTTYTRTWTFGGTITETMRPIQVMVTWNDRSGTADYVTLSSVISRTDPADSGFLGFPLPQNINLKRPKNRNINIPIAASALPGGKSAYQLAAGVTIVFSDLSGGVIERCTGTVNATSYTNNTAGCAVFNAYILAGYVSGAILPSGTPSPAASAPYFPAPTLPTGVNAAGLTGWDSSGGKTISCIYTRAIDQNDLSPPPTATSELAHYYLCLIPVTAGGTYSGTLRLGGVPINSNYKVCRFQYAASSFLTANMQNIQPYVTVNESLDNQNYYIENSNNATCPTITSSAGTVANGGSILTTLHQNCRSGASPTTTAGGACPLTTYNTLPN